MEEKEYDRVNTTFYEDFTIAERFGLNAVKDTFERAFKEWKSNVQYLAELILVLNHKIWEKHEKNYQLAKLYNDLWMRADGYAFNNFKGKELEHLYRVLD